MEGYPCMLQELLTLLSFSEKAKASSKATPPRLFQQKQYMSAQLSFANLVIAACSSNVHNTLVQASCTTSSEPFKCIMRLLNTETFELKTVEPGQQDFAILSHTWGADEVTYQQLIARTYDRYSKGWFKIENACAQASSDGFIFIWIDTCCIDKTNLVELSEAINSMFRWYEESSVCYAFLQDVELPEDPLSQSELVNAEYELVASRWFTRGWTLQELLAPAHVIFVDEHWSAIGTKRSLADSISKATGITHEHMADFRHCNFATKMTWMQRRETTKDEDSAYCLLGLFDVSMPLLYGEGAAKAFSRLQQEIIKSREDDTVLAWEDRSHRNYSILAPSPEGFQSTKTSMHDTERPSFALTNKGLDISPILYQRIGAAWFLMPLNCCLSDDLEFGESQIAVCLARDENHKDVYYRRRIEWKFPRWPRVQEYKHCGRKKIYIQDEHVQPFKPLKLHYVTLEVEVQSALEFLHCTGREVRHVDDTTLFAQAKQTFEPDSRIKIFVQPNRHTLLEMKGCFRKEKFDFSVLIARNEEDQSVAFELFPSSFDWNGVRAVVPCLSKKTPKSADYVKMWLLGKRVEITAHMKPRGVYFLSEQGEPLFDYQEEPLFDHSSREESFKHYTLSLRIRFVWTL